MPKYREWDIDDGSSERRRAKKRKNQDNRWSDYYDQEFAKPSRKRDKKNPERNRF